MGDKLTEIFEDITFIGKHKKLNWVDYEIYKAKIEGLGLGHERLEKCLIKLAEVMNL